ncbi:MAG: response regulator [Pseudomonadales bacterium]
MPYRLCCQLPGRNPNWHSFQPLNEPGEVSDDPRVRKTAVRVLRKLGYEVIEANSGEDALVSIKKNKNIDLMFSDIMMPGGMSGRQLASIVNTEYPKIKIQLTTGYENVDVTKNSADADFPLLRKPYDQQGLATALRKLLGGSGENTGFRKPDLPL